MMKNQGKRDDQMEFSEKVVGWGFILLLVTLVAGGLCHCFGLF